MWVPGGKEERVKLVEEMEVMRGHAQPCRALTRLRSGQASYTKRLERKPNPSRRRCSSQTQRKRAIGQVGTTGVNVDGVLHLQDTNGLGNIWVERAAVANGLEAG